jgi:hypothetical protein
VTAEEVFMNLTVAPGESWGLFLLLLIQFVGKIILFFLQASLTTSIGLMVSF